MKKYLWWGLAFFLLGVFVAVGGTRCFAEDEMTYPGVRSDWNGFDCYDFTFADRAAKLVVPKTVAPGSPWMWRARFFGHEPQTDIALLNHGFYVAYIDSAPLLGSPKSVELWQNFYLYLTETFHLSKKASLEGMSRGGLYVMKWAIAYPDEVAAIYIDNPVLDFKSWPGGYGKGARSDVSWQEVLDSYQLTQDEAMKYTENPVDSFSPLAEKKVPVLIVCGDSDKTVPYEENTKLFQERYEKAGGPIEVIVKPGGDHHPHSLKDPAPIVDFILKHQPEK